MAKNLDKIKKLREETGLGVMSCKKALQETGGDFKKAKQWLKKRGIMKAEKRAGRETGAGLLKTYTHGQGEIIGVVELACETDFVARNKKFQKLAHELAMQVAAMGPKTVAELMSQEHIKDESLTIEKLVKQTSGVLGENIKIKRIARFKQGENKNES